MALACSIVRSRWMPSRSLPSIGRLRGFRPVATMSLSHFSWPPPSIFSVLPFRSTLSTRVDTRRSTSKGAEVYSSNERRAILLASVIRALLSLVRSIGGWGSEVCHSSTISFAP